MWTKKIKWIKFPHNFIRIFQAHTVWSIYMLRLFIFRMICWFFCVNILLVWWWLVVLVPYGDGLLLLRNLYNNKKKTYLKKKEQKMHTLDLTWCVWYTGGYNRLLCSFNAFHLVYNTIWINFTRIMA